MMSLRIVVGAALVAVLGYGTVAAVRADSAGTRLEAERHRRTMARYEALRGNGAKSAVVDRLMAAERKRHAAATGSKRADPLKALGEAIDAARAGEAAGPVPCDEALEAAACSDALEAEAPTRGRGSFEAMLEAMPTRSSARLPYGNAGVISQKNGHVMCYIGANSMCSRCGARGNPSFKCKGSHELHLYGNAIRCRTCDRKWTPSSSLNSKCKGQHDIHIVGMKRKCIRCGKSGNLSMTPCKR